MISKPAIKFSQFNLKMYLLTLTVKELVQYTFVNIFNSETGEGYQRPLDPNHYRKISKYFINEDNPILPPTILSAINEDKCEYIDGYLKIKDRLRLVDGQHRIEGFKYLQKVNYERYKELENMEIPVTVLSISENDELYEINTFIDINSKGKKVSTDLAIRLRDSLRDKIKMYKSKKDLIESITTKTALMLNNKDNLSLWYDSIKVSPEIKGKIISINAFCQSLIPIVENFLENRDISIEDVDNEMLNSLVQETSEIVNFIWDVIEIKWEDCFSKYVPKFKKEYNLQKGTGAYSIHLLMSECIDSSEGDINKAKDQFEKIINVSEISSSDWITGGTFSGFSSKSGFKQIVSRIKNNKDANKQETNK